MRVIAVVNQKGGVGKTTTSVNLGAALARRGRRVLLVDMDPQGNLTDHLLDEPPPGVERLSIYDVIVDGKPLADAIVKTSTEGLSVVPSHQDLAGAELDLASVIGREVLLRDAIESLISPGSSDPYDYVFLDCPPSLGLLSLNALAAAQQVFIALQTEFFAMRGLGALDRTVDLVRRRINPALEVGGIIPTLVDSTRLAREVIDEVRGHYGDKVFLTKIRTNIRLAEAPSHGKHIFDYAPDSPGAADYAQLARELEEGRASVETPADVAAASAAAAAVAGTAPATAGAPAAVAKPSAPPLRGIAKAIADAAAAVSSGAPAGTRAPVVAKPTIPIPTSPAPAAASAAGPASDPKHAAATAPTAATPAHAATPAATPPPRVPAPSAVPMPVLRPGPRALPLAPLPTRPLSSLPRPSSPAAPATAGSGGRS